MPTLRGSAGTATATGAAVVASGSSTAPAADLGTVGTDDLVLAFFGNTVQTTHTPDTGWTQPSPRIVQANPNLAFSWAYRADDDDPTPSIVLGASSDWAAVAIDSPDDGTTGTPTQVFVGGDEDQQSDYDITGVVVTTDKPLYLALHIAQTGTVGAAGTATLSALPSGVTAVAVPGATVSYPAANTRRIQVFRLTGSGTGTVTVHFEAAQIGLQWIGVEVTNEACRVVLTWPTVADDDIALVGIGHPGGPDFVIPAPVGWQAFEPFASSVAGIATFWHECDGTETGTVTFALPAPARVSASIQIWDEVLLGETVIDGIGGESSGATDAVSAPSVDTSLPDGELVCFFVAYGLAALTFTAPSGMTEVSDAASLAKQSVSLEVARLDLGATGATGQKSATASGTPIDRVAQTIVLRDATPSVVPIRPSGVQLADIGDQRWEPIISKRYVTGTPPPQPPTLFNDPPVATLSAAVTPLAIHPDDEATLTMSSTDPDGDPTTNQLTVTQRPAGSSAVLVGTGDVRTFTFDKAGQYEFTQESFDDGGAGRGVTNPLPLSDTDVVVIVVVPEDEVPNPNPLTWQERVGVFPAAQTDKLTQLENCEALISPTHIYHVFTGNVEGYSPTYLGQIADSVGNYIGEGMNGNLGNLFDRAGVTAAGLTFPLCAAPSKSLTTLMGKTVGATYYPGRQQRYAETALGLHDAALQPALDIIRQSALDGCTYINRMAHEADLKGDGYPWTKRGVDSDHLPGGREGNPWAPNLARAGAASTITLAAIAPAFPMTTAVTGKQIRIVSGTGAGQVRNVSAYNIGTKVATVSVAWDVVPDATSVYSFIGNVGIPDGGVANTVRLAWRRVACYLKTGQWLDTETQQAAAFANDVDRPTILNDWQGDGPWMEYTNSGKWRRNSDSAVVAQGPGAHAERWADVCYPGNDAVDITGTDLYPGGIVNTINFGFTKGGVLVPAGTAPPADKQTAGKGFVDFFVDMIDTKEWAEQHLKPVTFPEVGIRGFVDQQTNAEYPHDVTRIDNSAPGVGTTAAAQRVALVNRDLKARVWATDLCKLFSTWPESGPGSLSYMGYWEGSYRSGTNMGPVLGGGTIVMGYPLTLFRYGMIIGDGTGRTLTGTAAAGGASTITFRQSRLLTNGQPGDPLGIEWVSQVQMAMDCFFDGLTIEIVSGTGSGQTRKLIDTDLIGTADRYIGSTRVATVTVPWVTPPDSTSVFELTFDLDAYAAVNWS